MPVATRQQRAEAVVVATLERFKRKQSNEDVLVECKREWPPPGDEQKEYEFIRQIAAHANAAGGDDIFWLIGVHSADEGVAGSKDNELANWRRRYESYFQAGVWPDISHINVLAENGENVVVLIIDTKRAPYVVRNPQFGKQLQDAKKPAGQNKVWMPIEWEVPYRVLESTGSATRHDLYRLLTPLAAFPECEVISCDLHEELENVPAARRPDGSLGQPYKTMRRLRIKILVCSMTGRIYLPWHRSSVTVGVNGAEDRVPWKIFHIRPQQLGEDAIAAVDRVGFINIEAHMPANQPILLDGAQSLDVVLTLGVVGAKEVVLPPIAMQNYYPGHSLGYTLCAE